MSDKRRILHCFAKESSMQNSHNKNWIFKLFFFPNLKAKRIFFGSDNSRCWKFHSTLSVIVLCIFIFIVRIHIVKMSHSLTVRYTKTLSSFPPIVSSSCPLYSSLSPIFTFIMWFCRIVLRRRWSICKVSSTMPIRYLYTVIYIVNFIQVRLTVDTCIRRLWKY